MFKKSLALLLTAMMILSSFTTVSVVAADASTPETVTTTLATVASEDFADYLAKYDADNDGTADTETNDKNIVYAYPSADVTGYGWANNWSTSATEYVAPVYSVTTNEDETTTTTDDKIHAYTMGLYETSSDTTATTQHMMKLNMVKTAYRQLAASVVLGEADGVYTFSVDVMHVNSGASARRPFRFDVGGLFSFGFDNELTAEDATGSVDSYAVPVIGVGETDTSAETKLEVGGGSADPEFVTYTATLTIDADGEDTITLTAQDRQTYQKDWDNVSSNISTVTVNADISGTVSYIGLGGTSALTAAAYVQNINIAASETIPVTYKELGISTTPYAQDLLGTAAGYTAWTNDVAVNTLYPTEGLAGSGFSTNWMGSTDGTTALGATVKAYTRFSGYPELKLTGVSDVAYRRLENAIPANTADGKYTFEFFAREGNGNYSARADVTYCIGDEIKVGYKWTEDLSGTAANSGEVTPYIQIGDAPAVTGGTLVGYGGYDYGEIVKFEISADIDADGRDVITLKAQDVTGPTGYYDTTAAVELVAAGNLSKAIEYIGIGAAPITSTNTSIYANVGGFSIYGASAFEAKTQNLAKELIAEETFTTDAGYTAWTGSFSTVIPTDGTITTSGWANNWSADAAGDTSLTENTAIEAYKKTSLSSVRFTAKTDAMYRKLSTPIVTDSKNAAYTFTFSASDEMSAFGSRSGVAYHLGDGIEIGYNWTSLVEDLDADTGLITPYVKIGDEKYTNGTLTTSGNSSYGEWVKFTFDLDLFADGSDYLTLTVQDNADYVNANGTTDTTEKVVIRVNEDVTASVDYVGFTNNLDHSTVKVALGDISITGAEAAGDITDDAYPYLDIAAEYQGIRSGEITEYGFDGEWTKNADGTGELDTDSLYYVSKSAYIDDATQGTALRVLRLAYDTTTSAYRQLEDVICTNDKAGSYTFTFDVADGISGYASRKPLAVKLGAGIEVGYSWTEDITVEPVSGADAGYITPYVKVGDGEAVTNGTLTQFGNDKFGEFTTFTVKVDLVADGMDRVTLTAKDNTSVVVNKETTYADEAVTVVANANITENIGYIGFTNTAKADIRDITVSGYGEPAADIADVEYPEITVAQDVFGTDGGYTAWTGELSANISDDVTTGVGFANNWKADAAGTAATIKKVQAATNVVKALRLETTSAAAYRKLAAPIYMKAKDGEYTFTFAASEGNGTHAARSGVAYHLGDDIEIGYNWTTLVDSGTSADAGKITPYVKVGGKTITNGELTTYGGYGVGEYVAFNLNIKLDADGSDLITLTVKDKETDTRDDYKNTEEAVTIAAAAQLTNVIDYIGFAVNADGSSAKIDLCDIAITGVEAPVITAVNTPATTDAEEIFGTDGGYASWNTDTAISGQFDGDKVTGVGFANNWKKDAAGTTATADGVMTASHKISSLRLNGAVSAYRQLEAPIAPAGKSGTYVFKFSSADAISAYSNRNSVAYYIGENIEVGYDWTEDITAEALTDGDSGYITPYIVINGTKISDESKKLTTYGNTSYGEWVDFELKVELGENGSDLLTLTVKDNTDTIVYSDETNGTTTNTDEVVTLTASADIGEAIEYIGFATKGGKTDFANIEISSSKAVENQPRTETQWTVATDELSTAGYVSTETGETNDDGSAKTSAWWTGNPLSNHIPEGTVTKSGWASNWAADTEGNKLSDNVVAYARTLNGVSTRTVRLVKGSSAMYRELEAPINLTNADASYTFIYSTSSGMGSVSNRSKVNFHIGDALTAGHIWDGSLGETDVSGDPSKLVPFIQLANGSVATASDYLRTLGGDSYGEFVTFEIKLDLFADGLDTVTVTAYDRAANITNASIDDKSVILQLATELSGTVDYIGFSLDGSSGDKKTDITDLKITTYNEDGVDEILAENLDKMGLGYEAARIIDSVEHGVAKAALREEFNKYGYAYEGFDAYADLEGTTYIAASKLEGGAGWDGGWTGNNIQIRQHNKVSGEYVLRAESPVLNVSRKLATPVDLTVDGEYFVKVSAYVDCTGSATVPNHDLQIKVGNTVFGTKGYYGETDLDGSGAIDESERARVSPTFGTDGTATVVNADVTYSGRSYNDYVLRIVSSADGDDTAYFYFVTDGSISEDELVTSGVITDDSFDTIAITCGTAVNGIRISEVAVDYWNDSFKEYKSSSIYDEGIVDGSQFTYYSDYKKAVDENDVQLPECVTTDYELALSGKSFTKGIRIDSVVLQNGNDTDGYVAVEDIALLGGSVERNVRVVPSLTNLGIANEVDYQSINMLIGFYYDGKLMGVKRAGIQLAPGAQTTGYYSYDFPTDHGWPEAIDYSMVDIKMFIFDWLTWAPLEHKTELYNSGVVIDGAEKIYVSSSYEGDTSDGSEAAPYTKVEDALDYIAALNTAGEYPVNGISVYIQEGEYTYPTTPLAFTSKHSGTASAPVKYIAEEGANFVGGYAFDLADFVATTESDAVYDENVKKYVAPEGTFALGSEMFPISGHQLAYFEDGTYNGTPYFTVSHDTDYMTLARWPETGYATVDSATSTLSTTMETTNSAYPLYDFTITDAELDGMTIEGDNVYIHGFWTSDYADFRTTAAYNAKENTFTADYPSYKKVTTDYDRRYYVSNSPSLLDNPGEWYIDIENDTLYVYPEKDTGVITVGTNTSEVIKGENVDNVVFQGISITSARDRGATFGNCDNIKFKDSKIVNVNGEGVAFNSCTGVEMDGCTVAYTGTGGVIMGGKSGSFVNQVSEGNVLKNSEFHDVGLWQKGYSEAISFGGYANVVENNKIYNTSHQAVSMSGFDNVFRRNEVYKVVSEGSDMGAIYVGKNPSNRGNRIEENYFHDIVSNSTISTTDIAAIFLDDCCAGFTIKNNIFENMGGKAMKTNGGRAHIMTGNVFINNNANAGYSCNGLGKDASGSYFMWTQALIDSYKADVTAGTITHYTDANMTSIQSGFTKYWGYITSDTYIANGAYKEAPFTKYTVANGYAEDLATYMDEEPLLAKYNIFKDNYAYGCTTDYYCGGANSDTEKYMTSDASKCEFVASEALDAKPTSFTSLIGIELTDIGPQK